MNINITPAQIGMGASALIDLLGRETTMVPGNLRPQIAVFEVVLNGILDGQFAVVPVVRNEVESETDKGSDAVKNAVKNAVKKADSKVPAKPKSKRK